MLAEAAKTDFDATTAWIAAHPGRLTHSDFDGLADEVSKRLNSDPLAFLESRAADGSLGPITPAINSALLNNASAQKSAVWEWLRGQPDDDATRDLRNAVIRSAAWQNPQLALSFVDDMPADNGGDQDVRELAIGLLNGGSMFLRLDNILQNGPERLRAPLLNTAFSSLRPDNMGDPNQWISRLDQLRPADRTTAEQSLARSWAANNPSEALSWANGLPATDRTAALAAVVDGYARKDPQAAGDWVNSIARGADRDRFASAFASAISEKYPREAWNWALSIEDPSTRQATAEIAAKMLASRDATSASDLIETSPLAEDAKAKLREAIANSTIHK